MNKIYILLLAAAICFASIPHTSPAAQTITAAKSEEAPIIDGAGTDPAWNRAAEIITSDNIANIDIAIKSIYTAEEIFFLVMYSDPDASRRHKNWIWNSTHNLYEQGYDREDAFVFKWSMESRPIDLSLSSDDIYSADVWSWKACRTDPSGYADDIIHVVGTRDAKHSMKLPGRSGKDRYLLRKPDSGTAAYKSNLQVDYAGYRVTRYANVIPTGSRADIRAKGVWKDGIWTIEFSRKLQTGNGDDVAFDTKKSYEFGVSRYEIAARKVNPKLSQPLYGSGDINEILTLVFGN